MGQYGIPGYEQKERQKGRRIQETERQKDDDRRKLGGKNAEGHAVEAHFARFPRSEGLPILLEEPIDHRKGEKEPPKLAPERIFRKRRRPRKKDRKKGKGDGDGSQAVRKKLIQKNGSHKPQKSKEDQAVDQKKEARERKRGKCKEKHDLKQPKRKSEIAARGARRQVNVEENA